MVNYRVGFAGNLPVFSRNDASLSLVQGNEMAEEMIFDLPPGVAKECFPGREMSIFWRGENEEETRQQALICRPEEGKASWVMPAEATKMPGLLYLQLGLKGENYCWRSLVFRAQIGCRLENAKVSPEGVSHRDYFTKKEMAQTLADLSDQWTAALPFGFFSSLGQEKGAILAEENLDHYRVSGCFNCSLPPLGAPEPRKGVLLVIGGSEMVHQLYLDTAGQIFQRFFGDDFWSSWKKLRTL